MDIFKLLLIVIEAGQTLLMMKKEAEFDDNVSKIKQDPKLYAINKFGTKRMRDAAKSKPEATLYSSDPDHHF